MGSALRRQVSGTPAFLEQLEPRQLLAALVDDRFENNDVPRQVTQRPVAAVNSPNLGPIAGTKIIRQLVLADAADIFRFNLPRAGRDGDYARIDFNNPRGNLDLQILGPGGAVLRTSRTAANLEQISLAGLAAGNYFVKVVGRFQVTTSPNYKLEIKAPTTPPVDPNEDAYENNDTIDIVAAQAPGGTSPNLGAASVRSLTGLKLSDKYDIYSFTLTSQGQQPSRIRIIGVNPLDMTLYNAQGQSVRASSAYQGQKTISFTGLAPGQYFVQVTHYALDTVGVFGYDLAFDA